MPRLALGPITCVAVIALGACSGAQPARQEAFATDGTSVAGASGGSASSTHNTFDGWVLSAPDVVEGTLLSIASPSQRFSYNEVLYRPVGVRIEAVYKGTLTPGTEITALENRFMLTSGDIGSTLLLVGAQFVNVRDDADGAVRYPIAMNLVSSASYVRTTPKPGLTLGLRLFSPRALTFGETGRREDTLERIARGEPVREALAPAWDDLIDRARNPRKVREEQLGYEEVRSTVDPTPDVVDTSAPAHQDPPSDR